MTETTAVVPPGPTSLGELMQAYPHRWRITGWDPSNPPEVERAFRVGFRIGADRCAACDLEEAADFTDRMHGRRGNLYWDDRSGGTEAWTDRRAALFRGAMHGGLEAIRTRVQGANDSLGVWLTQVHVWANAEPLQLGMAQAMPPEPPEPDGRPLGRDDVPKRLWSEVFGMWAIMRPPGQPSGNLTRVLHPERAGVSTPTVQARSVSPGPSPVTVRLSDVQPEQVRWLWPDRMALGKLTLLCGDPGLGKSFVTLDLAARVSSGSPWPDLSLLPNPAGGVVLLSAEDDLADTIRPRLDAADADPSRVIAIQAVRRTQPSGEAQDDYFDLTEDLPSLETAILQTTDCRLVVIDPLTAYLGKTDSHKNAEVRAVLAKLFELASRRKVAVLAVTHLNKAGGLPAIYRAMGSLAFVAAARAVWAVVRDENDDAGRRRLFVPVKNNIGADESGLAYALESVGDAARVAWEPLPVNMRADDALSGGQAATARDDAKRFVMETLTANGGDMLSDDLSAAAKAEGISERTLRRAREAVAQPYKEKGSGGRWRCRLKGGQE